MLLRELNEGLNKYFYNQKFYTLAKNNKNELAKMVSKFLRKKGITFKMNSYYSTAKTFSFKDFHNKMTPEIEKELKSLGFKGDEIEKIKGMKLILNDDFIESVKRAINDNVDYNYRNNINKNSEYKKYLNSIDIKQRIKIIKNVFIKLRNTKREIIKTSRRTEVGGEFFSVSSGSYNGGIKFPNIKYKGNDIEIQLATNDTFFEDGHDIKIKINDKNYSYKINLMRPFEDVINDIYDSVNLANSSFESGVEQPKENKESNTSKRQHKEDDFKKIARRYLDKWYTYTKTGKRKEASENRKPATYYIVSGDSSKNDSYKEKEKPQSFKLYVKVKTPPTRKAKEKNKYGREPIPKVVLDEFPDFEKWWDQLVEFKKGMNTNIPYSSDDIIPQRMFNNEHDKFFERLKGFSNRVARLGYYPANASSGYGKKTDTYIHYKYSEKLKNEYDKGNTEFVNDIIKNKEKNLNNGFYKGGFKIKDLPKKILPLIFNATVKDK